MRFLASILGASAAWLVDQACATSLSALENGFNSPASISARTRVQRPTRCPSQCNSYDTAQWFVYPSASRVARCNETMLLDFTVYNPLNDSDRRHTIRSCVANKTGTLKNAIGATSCCLVSSQSETTYQVGSWSTPSSTVSNSSSEGSSVLQDVSAYMTGNCQKSSIFAFSECAHIAVGMYVGGSVHHPQNIDSAVKEVANVLQDTSSYQIDLNGDLAAVQQHVQTWSDGDCVSGFTTINNNSSAALQRRSTCSYLKVVWGDLCASLVTECGITADEFYEYNPASDLYSTLAIGQYVCCSAGSLPDLAPSSYANGTCYTYDVQSGDTCSRIAADYTLTVDDIDSFNFDTWGWYGCDDLQAGSSICLSNGTAPLPLPIANAVCGPQVPGTNFTGTTNAGEWAALNPCPINVCCDIWGQCGNTPDYCNYTLAASGAPGTVPPGSNGCIWNCGTTIINDATEPAAYSSVGYFEATNIDRPCLDMNAFTIGPESYTHVLFAFGNITSDFAVSVAGAEQQFNYFTELVGMKRIISFGGWDFSTDPDTYMIFREGVTAANRDTFVENVANFVTGNDLDGVDFDWEYPGEPDIPGIPAGSDEDGSNYLEFLTAMRAALPDKSISITAPSSYWYLKAFPIVEIAEAVDFITYMTYDLQGVWDLEDKWAQDGCTAGDCLFSHVNLTETMWALSMISKAPVATSMIMVGVASYGRSFEMTTVGCWTSSCTWEAAGEAEPCTQTAGYISNAEINQILQENSNAQSLYSSGDSSNILVYNDTQWVSYMSSANKANRMAYYKTFNFAGTGEWAIDLEAFEPYVSSFSNSTSPGLTLEEFSSDPGGETLDVDTDIPCYSVSPSMNTSTELESVVVLGSIYIDEIFTEYAGDPTDWVFQMTSGHLHDTCASFPSTGSGYCSDLDEQWCFDGTITSGLYWASFLASELYATWVQWYDAFNQASFLSFLDISTIATTFTPTTVGNSLSFGSFLSSFSTALGIGTSVLPDPTGLFGDFSSGISTIESIIGLFPSESDFTLPAESDLETGMSVMLGTLVNSTLYALSNLSIAVFENPNEAATKISADLIDGPFTHPLANYFYNAKTVSTINTGNFTALINKITSTIEKYLVGAALADGDYYVVKVTVISEADCTDVAEYYMNDACYKLAYPGSSTSVAGQSIQAEASNTTITNIESYDINVADMIQNSEACQNATGVYYGAVDVNVTDVASSGTLPACFYNLPVFQLHDVTLTSSSGGDCQTYTPAGEFSPCYITFYQNGSTSTVTAGQTYLPTNLQSAFTEKYCTCGYTPPCEGTMNGTTNGTTNGVNIVR
ncbi:hypothetical protein BGW36DRAFT_423083 [Talaromyces proteolyticus]|uniref:chitinase n=1 Tax=Talaromyces proteolyticus TaxID=1131652 RepID=A0AAD4KYW1_9EURO|nr:uncharacterized protein BGW36DRAFT_423083 [Talaromyces proteolyticus]KAH8703522.1 hypothetical protein BGW36DRAFT_423083 [Talaromyces proteolyticus]